MYNTKLTCEDIFVNSMFIKRRSGSEVYTSTKKYQDKLFKLSGYKSVNTVTDLDELAQFKVTELYFSDYVIMVDEETASYIFVNSHAYEVYQDFMSKLDQKEELSYYRSYTADKYITNDQYMIKNGSGQEYLVKFCMLNDTATIYKYHKGRIEYDATIDLTDEDQSEYLYDIVTSPYDENYYDSQFRSDLQLTYKEMADILWSLSILKKSKKNYKVAIDENSPEFSSIMDLAEFLSNINSMDYLERSLTKINYTTGEIYELIANKLNSVESNLSVDFIYWIYDSILSETLSTFSNKVTFNEVLVTR